MMIDGMFIHNTVYKPLYDILHILFSHLVSTYARCVSWDEQNSKKMENSETM